jgi:hypothetical protein
MEDHKTDDGSSSPAWQLYPATPVAQSGVYGQAYKSKMLWGQLLSCPKIHCKTGWTGTRNLSGWHKRRKEHHVQLFDKIIKLD